MKIAILASQEDFQYSTETRQSLVQHLNHGPLAPDATGLHHLQIDEYSKTTALGVGEHEVVIAILTRISVSEPWFIDLLSGLREKQVKIIPVLLDDCPTPFQFRRLQYIDAATDFQAAMTQLAQALGITDQSTGPTPTAEKAPTYAIPEHIPLSLPSSLYTKQENRKLFIRILKYTTFSALALLFGAGGCEFRSKIATTSATLSAKTLLGVISVLALLSGLWAGWQVLSAFLRKTISK